MRYRLTFLFILFVNSFLKAQEKTSITNLLHKVENFYSKSKNFSYETSFKLFSNGNSNSIIDQYSGLTIVKNDVTYQKINNTASVSFKDYLVTVNDKDKTIAIVKTKTQNPPMVLTSLLKLCSKQDLKEEKKYWVCELYSKKENFRQFDKIIIYINKTNFSLYKEIFYTKSLQEIEKNKKKIVLKNPRLEITYNNNILKGTNYSNKLLKEYYFQIKNKKIEPNKRFQKYKLITI